MAELRLDDGDVSVILDAGSGGRLSSLRVGGHQLLITGGPAGSMLWGSYPLVPWAGRIRDGRFTFAGLDHRLPVNLPPHSAHGVGFDSAWSIVDDQTVALELGSPWPFGGRVTQRFDLERAGLVMTMTVEAEVDMPVMMGWHPWFARFLDGEDGPVEAELALGPATMYELDEYAIPTGRLVPPPPGPWDHCFTELQRPPRISWPGLVELVLSSSCDHWVVYTEPQHALCVEPQTDAPDSFNRDPDVVAAGRSWQAWFRLDWA